MTTMMDVANINMFLSYNVAASTDLGQVSQLVAMSRPTFIFLQSSDGAWFEWLQGGQEC